MSGLQYREIRYDSDSELQIVSIWEFPEDERLSDGDDRNNRLWFVYIHGGAWRDPRSLTESAVPAIDRILAGNSVPRSRIAGFASLGYRLSPHPDFPQDPASTPPSQMRVACHPDHVRDVWAGLAALAGDGRLQRDSRDNGGSNETIPATSPGSPADFLCRGRYIVYGHSCGAFLAFQLWMGEQALQTVQPPSPSPSTPGLPLWPPPPRCIVGLEGVYDLCGLVERGGGRGADSPVGRALAQIAEGAFGTDRTAWDLASPACFAWSGLPVLRTTQPTMPPPLDTPLLAVLAYSPEDELVDAGEIASMKKAFQPPGGCPVRLLTLEDLCGRHDEVHEDGREVARVLGAALQQLDELEQNVAG